jgi:hypothetical protein
MQYRLPWLYCTILVLVTMVTLYNVVLVTMVIIYNVFLLTIGTLCDAILVTMVSQWNIIFPTMVTLSSWLPWLHHTMKVSILLLHD